MRPRRPGQLFRRSEEQEFQNKNGTLALHSVVLSRHAGCLIRVDLWLLHGQHEKRQLVTGQVRPTPND